MTDEAEVALTELQRKIRKLYTAAGTAGEKQLAAFLQKFAEQDKEKRQQLNDGTITAEQFRAWRASILNGKDWMQLRDEIVNGYVKVDEQAADAINEALPTMYAEGYNYGTFGAEFQSGVDTDYTLLTTAAVAALIAAKKLSLPTVKASKKKLRRWHGKNLYSSTIQLLFTVSDVTVAAGSAKRAATRGAEAQKRSSDYYLSSEWADAQFKAYERAEEKGIQTEKIWLATLDSRTRHTHRLLDGERVGLHDKFSNGCMMARDPNGTPAETYNCRCATNYFVKGVEWDASDLSQRNTTHLKEADYQEWKSAKSVSKHKGESVRAYEARLQEQKRRKEEKQ